MILRGIYPCFAEAAQGSAGFGQSPLEGMIFEDNTDEAS